MSDASSLFSPEQLTWLQEQFAKMESQTKPTDDDPPKPPENVDAEVQTADSGKQTGSLSQSSGSLVYLCKACLARHAA